MDKAPAFFECNDPIINKAYRLATACVQANTIVIKQGFLSEAAPCVMAGLDYDTPWTRDAAINVMNAAKYIDYEAAKNTLLCVLEKKEGKTVIGDQYWDNVIWGLGAYALYTVAPDEDFLKLTYSALKNTLEIRIKEEFDGDLCLFRGAAVYGDGVSAYPQKYTNEDFNSGISCWADLHPDLKCKTGYGLPMFALSTNCLYVKAIETLNEIEKKLNKSPSFENLANDLKKSINEKFFNGKTYDYLYRESSAAEGLGLAFLLLFDIAPKDRADGIFENTFVTKFGIPCVYPAFERYKKYGYGRHSGTVWPHVQGFWARAALKYGKTDSFDREFFSLASNAVRDMQFSEIYHPETGEIYGGVQELGINGKKEYALWKSCDYQTWSATAFLNMIYEGIAGFDPISGEFNPYLPEKIDNFCLKNFCAGKKTYDVCVTRKNGKIVKEVKQK